MRTANDRGSSISGVIVTEPFFPNDPSFQKHIYGQPVSTDNSPADTLLVGRYFWLNAFVIIPGPSGSFLWWKCSLHHIVVWGNPKSGVSTF